MLDLLESAPVQLHCCEVCEAWKPEVDGSWYGREWLYFICDDHLSEPEKNEKASWGVIPF